MQSPSSEAYSSTARALHWLTVLALAIQLPIGVLMVNIENFPGFFYNFHKVFGLVILALVIVRLAYRLMHGAPPDEPTLNGFEKAASHIVHWSLYAILLVVAFVGWLGISTYDAREVWGFSIPSIAAKDQAFSERVFNWHKIGALTLFCLAGLHVAGALMHYVVKKDGVLARMLPSAGRRS